MQLHMPMSRTPQLLPISRRQADTRMRPLTAERRTSQAPANQQFDLRHDLHSKEAGSETLTQVLDTLAQLARTILVASSAFLEASCPGAPACWQSLDQTGAVLSVWRGPRRKGRLGLCDSSWITARETVSQSRRRRTKSSE